MNMLFVRLHLLQLWGLKITTGPIQFVPADTVNLFKLCFWAAGFYKFIN